MVLGPAHDCDACRALAVGILRNGSVANRPTALIGTTDIAAIGAVHAAIGLGLVVPDDVSVIGFDDLPEARYVFPALTTVAQPMRAIGVQLAARIAGDVVQPVDLPLRLVVRDTTAAPR